MTQRILISMLLVLAFLTNTSAFGAELKHTQINLFDDARKRPVKLDIWYREGNEKCGSKVCLPTSSTPTKFAMISHGSFGAAKDMNWIGYGLASQGWVVAGISHFGESWAYGADTIDYKSVSKYWLRAQDASFVLDSLTANSVFNTPIDLNNTLMLGHSSGGYTALSLVGADFNMPSMVAYCASKEASNDLGCNYARAASKSLSGENSSNNKPHSVALSRPEFSLKDNRITKIVVFDPALGQAVNAESLSAISVPTLIIGSVDNDFLNFDFHAKHYATHIKSATLVGLNNGEGHFVYIDSCSHKHRAQGVALCSDKKGVDRKQVQRRVTGEVFKFLARVNAKKKI